MMRKAYEAHEREYQRMRMDGIQSWFQRREQWSIDPHDEHFLQDVLAQSWAPHEGVAIELGCGTGALVRWLSKKGFTTLGVDISQTAIQMAIAQSEGYGCQYLVGDICSMDTKLISKCDICIDGRFLHCITSSEDRTAVLKKVQQILNPGGVFVLMSMCSPIDYRSFSSEYKSQRILDNVIYSPTGNGEVFRESRTIGKTTYNPTRYVAHWQKILVEIRRAGVLPTLVRFNRCSAEEPVSSLNVAALTTASTTTNESAVGGSI
jgi:2-polyprenyl-3-methyl-5-hydroxy-6-metoxy-1,4-benzoquinol methylase